jgi:hypothetical protein
MRLSGERAFHTYETATKSLVADSRISKVERYMK